MLVVAYKCKIMVIFNMTYKMFLDDERDPIGDDWVVVRNYKDAISHVLIYGFPEFISFDHDLGEGKSGYDFAHFLVNHDLVYNDMPDKFDYYVHSQNPVGAANITGLLDNYVKQRNME